MCHSQARSLPGRSRKTRCSHFSDILEWKNDFSDTQHVRRVTFFVLEVSDHKSTMLIYLFIYIYTRIRTHDTGRNFELILTRQMPYRCLTDRVIFFLSGFWPGPPVATPQSHRPGFFHFFKSHFWPSRQWPYLGLSDCTDILRRKNDRKETGFFLCWRMSDRPSPPVTIPQSPRPAFFSIWNKNWSRRLRYGHWWTGSKTWMPVSVVLQNFPLMINDGWRP